MSTLEVSARKGQGLSFTGQEGAGATYAGLPSASAASAPPSAGFFPKESERYEEMGLPETLAVLMVVSVCVLLFAGYPVALTLGGVSLAFAGLGHLTGAMSFSFLGALPQRLMIVELDAVESVGVEVDGDRVAVVDQRDRAAEERLR